eukprot:GEMP01002694.1.p1 GENE.GEMP01002694.1~~GEMP01002694.1.p1  ORF type:complete len:867 (+),score=165.73 GEMP01002694.1:288-2888(+)
MDSRAEGPLKRLAFEDEQRFANDEDDDENDSVSLDSVEKKPELPMSLMSSTSQMELFMEPCKDAFDIETYVPGLRNALKHRYGNFMAAWTRGFKQTLHGSIKFVRFVKLLEKMTLTDKKLKDSIDVAALYCALGEQKRRLISLRDIDAYTSVNVETFKDLFAQNFQSVDNFFCALDTHGGSNITLTKSEFHSGLARLGFVGDIDMLFEGLDTNGRGCISADEFVWLEDDLIRRSNALSRIKGQENERQRILKMKTKRKRDLGAKQRAARHEFLAHCRRKYGSIVRAWRQGLDRNHSMAVGRHEFMKFCADTGFTGDRKLAWTELDKDNSGKTTLEEIDMYGALMLAQFREFIKETFNSWNDVFERAGTARPLGGLNKKTTEEFFVRKVTEWGFTLRPPLSCSHLRKLFRALDLQGCGIVRREDVMFIRQWVPPPWMTVDPDHEARANFTEHLKTRHGNLISAWKSIDTDETNIVSWQKFFQGALHSKYGNIRRLPSIWRSFDANLCGYITLRDLNKDDADILEGFVIWARSNFGDVVSAFQVLDADQIGELSFHDFRSSMRLYGYSGDVRQLFIALDNKKSRKLSAKTLAFLDSWDMLDHEGAERAKKAKYKWTKTRVLFSSLRGCLQNASHKKTDEDKKQEFWFPKCWCTRNEDELECAKMCHAIGSHTDKEERSMELLIHQPHTQSNSELALPPIGGQSPTSVVTRMHGTFPASNSTTHKPHDEQPSSLIVSQVALKSYGIPLFRSHPIPSWDSTSNSPHARSRSPHSHRAKSTFPHSKTLKGMRSQPTLEPVKACVTVTNSIVGHPQRTTQSNSSHRAPKKTSATHMVVRSDGAIPERPPDRNKSSSPTRLDADGSEVLASTT